ncbi:MAG: alpha/beta hydrolase [Hyphomicrobiales bacterium]|nr:alpha/beta hydrolase [Hyphomicrobiales bacterium]MDE2283312.1 alpha/beta hydrolase [Hyphomicrobiales bacterium]
MRLLVDGNEVFIGTGGRDFDAGLPAMVFLHGAGMDHSVWALLARAFAHHGHSVLAPDLPGHGRSGGAPLASIAALADWTAALIEAAGAGKARLVGHSMGSLIALETAARHPGKVTAIALIATAAPMRVSDDLLNAAKANDHAAVDMIDLWGHGYRASMGGSQMPGLWMLGDGERLLERSGPGVIFADLSACNDYADALAAAAKVRVPATVVVGSRDLMTPARSAKAVAAAIPNCRLALIDGAGHMLMSERPDDVLAALRA